MSLIELTNQIEALKGELRAITAKFEQDSKSLKARISELEKNRNVVSDGLDLGLVQTAESCMHFEGNPGEVRLGSHGSQYTATARQNAIADAIKIIAESNDPLKSQYIGIKNYGGFGDQRCDCEYGMCPRHGSIVFRIGRKNTEENLTEEQRNACIYYLMNWGKIYQAKGKAA